MATNLKGHVKRYVLLLKKLIKKKYFEEEVCGQWKLSLKKQFNDALRFGYY